jgi:4-carboxymuconolactone decarboxylase
MDRRKRGVAVYADQFGTSAAEAERRFVERFGSRLAEEAFSAQGGSAWDDTPLSRRDRSLVVVAVLATQGGVDDRLRTHVRWAIENGATPDELDALVCLVAGYAGFPRASVAMEIVRDELAATDRPLPA